MTPKQLDTAGGCLWQLIVLALVVLALGALVATHSAGY